MREKETTDRETERESERERQTDRITARPQCPLRSGLSDCRRSRRCLSMDMDIIAIIICSTLLTLRPAKPTSSGRYWTSFGVRVRTPYFHFRHHHHRQHHQQHRCPMTFIVTITASSSSSSSPASLHKRNAIIATIIIISIAIIM